MHEQQPIEERIALLTKRVAHAAKLLTFAPEQCRGEATEMVMNYSVALFQLECGNETLAIEFEANAQDQRIRIEHAVMLELGL